MFKEMVEYEELLYQVSVCDDGYYGPEDLEPIWGCTSDDYRNITLEDLCKQSNLTVDEEDLEEQIGYTPRKIPGPKCLWTQRPLDFVYNKYNDTYNISDEAFADDKELLERIQTGKGDTEIYSGFLNLYVDNFLAGTVPEDVDQDILYGDNDI